MSALPVVTAPPFSVSRAPRALPLLGHARALLGDPLRFLVTLPSYGDLVWIRLGPVRALVVCHPELNREMLQRDRDFDKGGPLFQRAGEFIGNGLVTCPHADHRRQRRLMQPAFHPARFPDYATVMSQCTAAVVSAWQDGQVVDAFADIYEITAQTMSVSMFAGLTSDARLRRFRDALSVVLEGSYRRLLTPPGIDRLPTPGRLRYDRARACVREITGQFIDEYGDGADRHDLLSMLLAARGDDGRPLSAEEVCDQVTTLFAAGTESTSSTIGWAMYLLARHPEVQRRLRDETGPVLAGRAATWDDLPLLGYARQVITETLRLYPPAWLLTRVTARDTELGGCPLPAGTILVYSAYLQHHRADGFPDPECFDPGRWADEQPPRGRYSPFGSGPRKCIGDTFALTQAVMALATIVSRWELTLAAEPDRLVPRLVHAPRGIQIRLGSPLRAAEQTEAHLQPAEL
jgi:cytochrome P450